MGTPVDDRDAADAVKPSPTQDRVLVVENQTEVSSGLLGPVLREEGIALDICRPFNGERLPSPEQIKGFGGILILGGSMAAWEVDKAPWIQDLMTLVRAAEDQGVPTLGICLGSQVAARALGGEVRINPRGRSVDVVDVGWTDAAADDPLVAGLSDAVAVHGNRDVVWEPPAGAEVLAWAPDGTIQVARWGRSVWGIQYHPEAGPDEVEGWVTRSPEMFDEVAIDGDTFLSMVRANGERVTQAAAHIARNLVEIIRQRGA